jgi:Asp-tRNA(Asn)/Glu-tRNA(Gln) amidotransferase A subunit family amidase
LIQDLKSYHGAYTSSERDALSKPIDELVQDVYKQIIQPIYVLRAYSKAALKAHENTNCVTEVMIDAAEGGTADGRIKFKRLLTGISISLKDSIVAKGLDTTVACSLDVGNIREGWQDGEDY